MRPLAAARRLGPAGTPRTRSTMRRTRRAVTPARGAPGVGLRPGVGVGAPGPGLTRGGGRRTD
jgi:hypothetical protein